MKIKKHNKARSALLKGFGYARHLGRRRNEMKPAVLNGEQFGYARHLGRRRNEMKPAVGNGNYKSSGLI